MVAGVIAILVLVYLIVGQITAWSAPPGSRGDPGVMAQQPTTSSIPPQPPDAFVAVNGVRLHYFDWGGSGDPVLMLTPLGASGHVFDSFAPRFMDAFRVLVLTRRGQGQSDKPPSGYDLDTLAADIRGFMDALHIDRAHLVGHSIAGAEMTRFATTYPERVRKLVYLDAANDYAALDEISRDANPPPVPDNSPSNSLAAISAGAAAVHPEYARVNAPALAFFVVYDGAIPSRPEDGPAIRRYLDLLVERQYIDKQIETFRTEMKHGQLVLVRNARHADFFSDPRHINEVVRAVRTFLSQ